LLEAARVQQERFPEGINNCLFFNEPYALIQHREPNGQLREWLLSPYVEGDAVEDQELALAGAGGSVTAFEAGNYPDLARIVTSRPYDVVLFPELARAVTYRLGFSEYDSPVRDLHGGNILVQQSPAGHTYTVIDL
jgi:hypothetical protein